MGQYYIAVILVEKERIRACMVKVTLLLLHRGQADGAQLPQ